MEKGLRRFRLNSEIGDDWVSQTVFPTILRIYKKSVGNMFFFSGSRQFNVQQRRDHLVCHSEVSLFL